MDIDLFCAPSASPPQGGLDHRLHNPVPQLLDEFRARFEENYHADRAPKPARDRTKAPRAGNYTTAYAKAHAKKLGWTLIASEQYDSGAKRHYDIIAGLDCLFMTKDGKLVGVQAAGKGERAEHHRRFIDRRGPAKCTARHMRVLYWVFTRESKIPDEEVWLDEP